MAAVYHGELLLYVSRMGTSLELRKEKFLKELAESMDISREELNENSLLDDLPWDSLAAVTSIAILDDCFNVTVPGDKIADCKTVIDIIKLAIE